MEFSVDVEGIGPTVTDGDKLCLVRTKIFISITRQSYPIIAKFVIKHFAQ